MYTPAQLIHDLTFSPTLSVIREKIDAARIVADAMAIQQIPGPTFDEAQRAAFVRERFAQYERLTDVSIDSVYNVYGRWPGEKSDLPALLISAHMDTVFPLDTDLTLRHEEGRIYGPGLGDNSLGVAALLALLEIVSANRLSPAPDIWFVANSREEGLGDLGGMRAVWAQLGKRLGAAIVLEGLAFGGIYHAGIAVRRLRFDCHTSGGHSWLNFGQPSAIHSLIQLGAQIVAYEPPENPRTTYNIGLIQGGRSVNSIASDAHMVLDLRSVQVTSLHTLEEYVMKALDSLRRPGVEFDVSVVGDRPAGQITVGHPLVQLASAALREVGIEPSYEIGSTDANVLLANGLPTVTVGVSRGGQAHRLDEYINTEPVANGIWYLLLLVLAVANQMPGWASLRAQPS